MRLNNVTEYFEYIEKEESLLHYNLKQLNDVQDYLLNISSLDYFNKEENPNIMQQLINLQYVKRAIRDLIEAYNNKELITNTGTSE